MALSLKPNLERRGRILRAISGTICVFAGAAMWAFAWPESVTIRGIVAAVLILIGLFQWFEARRSWCVVRACGIRTPI